MHPHWYVSLSACAGHLRKSFGCSVCWLCARAPTHIDTPTCTQTLIDDRCADVTPAPLLHTHSRTHCAGHLRKSFGCSVCWLCARAPTHIDTPTCTQTLTDDRCCSCHPGPTPTHTLAHPSRGEHKPCPWKVIESCAWVEHHPP